MAVLDLQTAVTMNPLSASNQCVATEEHYWNKFQTIQAEKFFAISALFSMISVYPMWPPMAI
jgi:hypothetical protein